MYNTYDKVEVNEMGGICSMHGERRNEFRVFVGNLEEKRQPGKPERMWKNNINTNLREIKWRIWI